MRFLFPMNQAVFYLRQANTSTPHTDLRLPDLPLKSLTKLHSQINDETNEQGPTSYVLHPDDLTSQTLAQEILALLNKLRIKGVENTSFIFFRRVPNIPRQPLALLRREVSIIPEALKPYVTTLNLHLDMEISASRKAGFLVATCSPTLATTLPSSSIFHGTSLTTPPSDTRTYAFLEIATLFHPNTFPEDTILSRIMEQVTDEIARNSLTITRKIISPQQHQILSFVFACPRDYLPQILTAVHQTWTTRESPVFSWAAPIATLDDLTEQSDHFLISSPITHMTNTPLPLHPLVDITQHIRSIMNSRHLLSSTILPTSQNAVILVCAKDSIRQELITQLPPHLQIMSIHFRTSSQLLRASQKALMVHPALKPGQQPNTKILEQLSEALRNLFPTQFIEERRKGFKIHQLNEEIHIWRNFEGYLGPLKVRMGIEKEKQMARDFWWARQDNEVKFQINEHRKNRISMLLESPPTFSEDQQAEERNPQPDFISSTSIDSMTRIFPEEQSKRSRTPLSANRNPKPRLEAQSSTSSPEAQSVTTRDTT